MTVVKNYNGPKMAPNTLAVGLDKKLVTARQL